MWPSADPAWRTAGAWLTAVGLVAGGWNAAQWWAPGSPSAASAAPVAAVPSGTAPAGQPAGTRASAARAAASAVPAAGRLATAASTSATSPAGFALERTTLADGQHLVLRWNPCQVITYKVDVAAVPAATRAAVLLEIRTAVGRLAMATGLTYGYRGTTTEVPSSTTIDGQSAELVIAVTSRSRTDIGIGGRVLGYGGYHFWRWTGATAKGSPADGAAIARGWVVLDRTGWLALPPGFGAGVRRGNVVLHELGHTVGLDHVTDRHQLMYPTLLAGAPNGYATGDRAGLARLGRAAGCITVPPGVIADLG